MHKIVLYTTRRGNSPVDEFLDGLDAKARAKVDTFIEFLAREGHRLQRPYTDTLRGKIRGLRIPHRTNQYRVLYFFQKDSIVLLCGFAKKTQEIPRREIERAEYYMQDFIKQSESGEITP